MKKITSIFLLLALVLSIMGCTQETGESTGTSTSPNASADSFAVGYSRININPEESVALDGYGNPTFRYCTDIIDDVYTTTVAICDSDGSTVILINADIIQAYDVLVEDVKTQVTARTGIPGSNVVICGTHSHSVPAVVTNAEENVRYKELVIERMIQSVQEALADMKPVTAVSSGSIEAVGLNFVRHYTMIDDATGEESVAGDNFGTTTGKTCTGHTAEADPTMHLVRIEREGANDVVMINWRAHPHFTGGRQVFNLSSDYIGPFREAFEELSGANFIYFQGAAGNVNEKSRITDENITTDYNKYGCLLADYAMEALKNNMTEVEWGEIKVDQLECYSDINKTMDQWYYSAKAVQVVWASTNDKTKALAAAGEAPIRSPYHANAIVANYSRTREENGRMELTAISIGEELSFVTFPGEAFDTISEYVEENSPYDMTMFIGYANHHIGYLPNSSAWEYTSYETDITRFVQGTDLIVQDAFISLLESLKNS